MQNMDKVIKNLISPEIGERVFYQYFTNDQERENYVWVKQLINERNTQLTDESVIGYDEAQSTISDLELMINNIERILKLMTDSPEIIFKTNDEMRTLIKAFNDCTNTTRSAITAKNSLFNEYFATNQAKENYIWAKQLIIKLTNWSGAKTNEYYDLWALVEQFKAMITDLDAYLEFMIEDPKNKAAFHDEMLGSISTFNNSVSKLKPETKRRNTILFLAPADGKNYIASDIKALDPGEQSDAKRLLNWLYDDEGIFETSMWQKYKTRNLGNVRAYYLEIDSTDKEVTLLLAGLFSFNPNDKENDRPRAYRKMERRDGESVVAEEIARIKTGYAITNPEARNHAIADLLVDNEAVKPIVEGQLGIKAPTK